MKVEERIFPRIISPFDIRDYRIAVSMTEFPETFALPTVSVKNQASTGSCVAHACSTVVEYHNKRQENTNVVFSTEFIYGYRPAGYYVGTGMCIRDALKTICKLGDVPLTTLRGNHEYAEAMEIVESKIGELKDAAYPHRISSYAKVKTDDEIKQALMSQGYVVVSMPWYADYKLQNGVYTWTSEEEYGLHAVVIYGWDERGWLVQNSWGSTWGQKGRFVVPFGFKWRESWAIVDTIEGEANIVRPADNIFIKTFSGIINWVAKIFRKLFKKI